MVRERCEVVRGRERGGDSYAFESRRITGRVSRRPPDGGAAPRPSLALQSVAVEIAGSESLPGPLSLCLLSSPLALWARSSRDRERASDGLVVEGQSISTSLTLVVLPMRRFRVPWQLSSSKRTVYPSITVFLEDTDQGRERATEQGGVQWPSSKELSSTGPQSTSCR